MVESFLLKQKYSLPRGNSRYFATTIQALVESHDEVIIVDPSYDCYEAPILLCNAKPAFL
jgi:aspartate/methionine/tyrosine aminotransferase